MKHRCCPQPNWRNKTVCDWNSFSAEHLGTCLASVSGYVDRLPPAGRLSNCSRDVLKICSGIHSSSFGSSLLTLLCNQVCVPPVPHDGHSSDIRGVLSVCVVHVCTRFLVCVHVRKSEGDSPILNTFLLSHVSPYFLTQCLSLNQ